ncbi:MAG: signal peptide peptidase SppA [Clostridiales Family XIII bacterium]|nr:signal peptide peptidase SppA [Clostridiales Family XIII bacterium]
MSGGKIALLIVGILLGLFVVMFGFVAMMKSALGLSGSSGELIYPSEEYIGRVMIVGEIGAYDDPYTSSYESYHHNFTMNAIDDMMYDSLNRGLFLYVDTPGGTVYESDALYLKILEYQEVTGRPVYVYMGSMAASGGYYISANADKIYANRNCWTGSIGVVVGTLFDVSGFLEQHGIKAENITSGANKSMGGYFEPMTEEQRAIFQSLVDEAFDQFVGIVADGRDMTEEEVRKIADGRIYTASQAEEIGLIDGICAEEDALYELLDLAGDTGMRVFDVEYTADTSVLGLLAQGEAEQADAKYDGLPSDIAAVLKLAEGSGEVPIKYLYEG